MLSVKLLCSFFSWAAFSRSFNFTLVKKRRKEKYVQETEQRQSKTKPKLKSVLLDTVQPSSLFSGHFSEKNKTQTKTKIQKTYLLFLFLSWARFLTLSLLMFSSAVSRFILMCSDIRAVSEGSILFAEEEIKLWLWPRCLWRQSRGSRKLGSRSPPRLSVQQKRLSE